MGVEIKYNIIKYAIDFIYEQSTKMNVEQRTINKIVEVTDKAYTVINKYKIKWEKKLIWPKLFLSKGCKMKG